MIMDAYEAREAEEAKNRQKAIKVAEQLFARAERLKEHARNLLAFAGVSNNTDDPWARLELLTDMDIHIIQIKVAGQVKYLDLPTLEFMGVKDIEDEELLQEYVGSSADITEQYLAHLAEWKRRWDETIQQIM